MLFSRTGSVVSDTFSLFLNGLELRRVDQFKYLGIILDENLSFHKYVKTLSLKISRNIGMLTRLCHFFPKAILKSIYYSFVHPYFLYCISVWASTFPSVFKSLQILQNKAMRILFNVDCRTSVRHLYGTSGIFSLDQLHLISISSICHDYQYSNLPVNFSGIFSTNSQFHNYPTTHRSDFSCEIRPTSRAGFSIRHTGPKIWNSIPASVRECSNKRHFLRLVKKYLMTC